VRAYVRLSIPGGSSVALGPGDFLGRLACAALPLDDGRISEAHAMVSLRGRELKLLALRGHFAIDGQPRDEVVLRPGLVIEPAPGLRLVVEEVRLPDQVLALEGDGLPRQLLTGTVSITTTPELRLWPRYRDDAFAHIWDNGEEWRIRIGDDPARGLAPGDELNLGGRTLRAVAVDLENAGGSPTRLDGTRPALHLIAHYDTVHIHVAGRLAVTLDGLAARIVSELAALGGPVAWEVLAGELWRGDDDRGQLRGRWDVALTRLRRKLRDARVRPDLVRTGGTGQVELLLYPGDRLDNQT
jgi:hypothetical protein